MDKIYSRTRIKIPNVKIFRDGKYKRIYFPMVMLLIVIITGYRALKSIDPVFEGLCVAKAQSIATDIANRKSSEVLGKYSYNDTVQLIKSDDGQNSILKTDIVKINQIVSDITIEIQKELNSIEKENIEIPAGALFGNKYITGFGPKFRIRIVSVGDITTNINTEFKAAGINQTVYRIYLNLECNVSIITAYKAINRTIINQVLLGETVVVGNVPETYVELDKTREIGNWICQFLFLNIL